MLLLGRLHRSTVLRLDAPTRDDQGDTTLAAIVLDPGADPLEQLERRERDNYVLDALQALPSRMLDILVGYFLEGRTSGELAEDLGVTESSVSQMRTEALRLVRQGLAEQYGEPTVELTGRAGAKQAAFNATLTSRSSFAGRLSTLPRPRTAPDLDLMALSA